MTARSKLVTFDTSIFQKMKEEGRKIATLSLYTYRQAVIAQKAGINFILVGDSVAMTEHKYPSTRFATPRMMKCHGRQVVWGAPDAFVVMDMTADTYQNPRQAWKHALRLIQATNAKAVKPEGGVEKVDVVKRIVDGGIPVLGHIGLLPQNVKDGKWRIAGRGKEGADKLLKDALALQEAGAFALVIEGTVEPVASAITKELKIPTIGIGGSPDCDWQILVWHDAIGQTAKPPKFSQNFMPLGDGTELGAILTYKEAVEKGLFPDRIKHCYAPKEGDMTSPFYGG